MGQEQISEALPFLKALADEAGSESSGCWPPVSRAFATWPRCWRSRNPPCLIIWRF